MNVMTTEILEENAGRTAEASVQKRDVALARLMKAWESKNARAARRAGGLSLVAVTLAACNGSSDGGSSSDGGDGGDNGGGDNGGGDNGGGDNGGGVTTPIAPGLVEPDFFVLDFPTQTVTTTVFNVDGEPVSVEDALAAFAQLADVPLPDGENITVENLNVVQEALGGSTPGNTGGENTINIGEGGSEQQLSFDEFLDLIQTQDIITVGSVILTPQDNSGIVFAPGFPTGDQFVEGEFGTSGNPGSGDDVIFLGRTELLHAAILDGGGGADELRIVAKGPYAQPFAIRSIETVRILNSQNTTVDVLDAVDGQNILTEEDVDNLIVTTFPTFNSPFDSPGMTRSSIEEDDNTWIDLGPAFGLSSVVIGENAGVTDSNLFVVGVNNGATLVLQGGFENDVTVDYGFNFGGTVFNLRLEDVNFSGGEPTSDVYDGNGSQLLIAQDSTHLAIESTGPDATVENFIYNGDFGGNLRQLTITGDKFLHIQSAVDFNENRSTIIDAGANTGGVKLEAENDSGNSIANNTINVVGSQGDDDFTLTADAFNITSGAGENSYDLTGSYSSDNVDTGMRLVFNGAAGDDTIIIQGQDASVPNGFAVSTTQSQGAPTILLAESSITGINNTVVTTGDVDLSAMPVANISGISSVVMGGTLTVTAAQVEALGADAFSAVESAENAGTTQTLLIEMTESASLSDLLDLSTLSPNVKLDFFVPADVTLTMSAEELHNFLTEDAINLGDGSNGTSPGKIVITDAGENFDPFDSGDVDEPDLPLIPGGGTVAGSPNNVEIIRPQVDGEFNGFNRPSQEPIDDTFLIDSDTVTEPVGPNQFGDPDQLSLPQETTTLLMTGANDITFTAPVSFEGTESFTIDFSEVEGTVSGLEIVVFNDIAPNPPTRGEVIGNGGARVDLQLTGQVGAGANGLISSGVATYVVTDIDGGPFNFFVADSAEDLEVLGLQGNAGETIAFKKVGATVNFLMEGDGIANFADVPNALSPIDESNIGTLKAEFDDEFATINAEVEINNQGVELGAASDGGERELYVDGIVIDNAQSITLNISDGDADIGGQQLSSGVAGVQGDSLEDLIINNVDDVTLTVDDTTSSLESLDASGVDGTMTLLVLETPGSATVDLSGTTLTGIDAIEMEDGSDLTLTVEQALDIGTGNVSVEDGATTGTATLTLNVTEDFNIDDLDVTNLPDGLTLNLSLQSEVELNITGAQLNDLLEAGVVINDDSGTDDPGTLNITDFTQANLQDGDGNTINYAPILPSLATSDDIAGTITTDGSDLFVPSAADPFLGDFAWELESGTLGLSQEAMADELAVNNGDIQFFFVPSGGKINAAEYTNIGKVFVNEFGLSPSFNVESITFLDSDTEVEIVPLVPLEFDGVDRMVIVGGVPFAADDGSGTGPFNPGTGDAGPVTSGVNLVFNNVSGDENFNVETITIAFEEGGNIIGDIIIGVGELPNGNAFETLTLISNGNDVNTIEGDISAPNPAQNLLTVNIEANQDLVIGDDPVTPTTGTIILSSVDAGADATVTITGTEKVTVKGIDATDPDIATLTVDTSGHSGTYTVAGGSPSIDAGETLVFVGGVDSTVELDTADLTPPDEGNRGVKGNGVLELLDASGMEGTLALGEVNNVADGFELIGGTGVITANILNLPPVSTGSAPFVGNWSLDISNAEAGSQIDTALGSLTSGSLALSTDEDDGTTTLTFGDDTTHVANGPLDLSGFDNIVFGENVEFVLGEGGLVLMSDDQFAAFDAAGGDITGETSVIFDGTVTPPGTDLTEVRGLEEIGLEEGSGPYTLTSEQVGIAFPVDSAGDPTAVPGDINALKADPGLVVQVNDGDTFALTDVEADGLSINGDGAVDVTIVGTPGATLDVTAGGDNNPGQSITVNFELNGNPGSVTVDNTTTDFTLAGQTTAAIVTALTGVAGITSPAAGEVEAESGDSFFISSIDVVDGGSGLDVDPTSFVSSDANMAGNVVVDTTHTFPDITNGFYKLEGAITLGGAADGDGNLTITLDAQGGNFIDAEALFNADLPTAAPGDTEIVLVGGPQVKFRTGFLDGKAVTGTGSSVQVEDPITADFSTVDVPVEILLTADTTFTGSFNPGQLVTVVDPAGTMPEFELDITNATGLPSSFVLDGTTLELTVVQADGLTITGGSTALVTMNDSDPAQADNNAILSNIDTDDVDVVIEVTGSVEFGGELPGGQITIEGVPGTPPFPDVFELKPGATLGTGISFSVAVSAALQLTGAQADGLTIEGAGRVILTDVLAGQDLSGLSVTGNVTVQFDDATETEFELPASAISGSTVIVENVSGTIDTLTIKGVEDSDADFSGLSVTAGGGTGDVELELNSDGDPELGADADFGLTSDGGSGDITLEISGTGTVTVDGGADLTGVDAYTVEADATLVADASATGNAVVDTSKVTGEGTLEHVALNGQNATATDEVKFNEFIFDSADQGVTINGFEAVNAIDGSFLFAPGEVGTMSLDLSSFDTTGNDFVSVTTGTLGTVDLTTDGVVVITDGTFAVDIDGANTNAVNGSGAQTFIVVEDSSGTEAEVYYWDDTTDANPNDGIIDDTTLVATLDSTTADQLGSDNFVI